jgi:hypothetical protein
VGAFSALFSHADSDLPMAGAGPYQIFTAVMDVLGDLGEIAHIEPLRTERALFKVIGLGLSDPVAIGTGVARKFSIHHRSSRTVSL